VTRRAIADTKELAQECCDVQNRADIYEKAKPELP